jgi:hypothetical protein
MKKLQYIYFLCLVAFSLSLSAQHKPQPDPLITKIIGKWKVVKYQASNSGASATTDTLVFEPDGTFRSDSIYFKTTKGLYRTDETRKVLIIDAGGKSSEWAAALDDGVLRLKSLPDRKRPKVHITLVKVPKEDLVNN